jgi:hypothetical protein
MHNGYEVYYKKPININFHKATIFNDNYNYYYYISSREEDREEYSALYRPLGKFERMSKENLVNVYTFKKNTLY